MKEKSFDGLRSLRENWETNLRERGATERRKDFLTRSEIPVRNVYTPLDLEKGGFDYFKDLNFPGEYPYTRGIEPLMYRENLWLIGQYGGFGSPQETNQRFNYLLSRGITALTLALDLPTQMGYDSDHPMSKGEVGKTGVAIDSLADMEVAFADVPLNAVRMVGTLANAIRPHRTLLLYGFGGKTKGFSNGICGLFAERDFEGICCARGLFSSCGHGVKA